MKKLLSEFIGTYALVFAGTGSVIIDQQANGVITHLGIAITFGLVLMSMIYTFGGISGAHFNPAVSIAFSAAGKLPVSDLPGFVTAQVLGAICASLTMKFLFPANELLGATIPSGPAMQSFVLEMIITFLFMLVIIDVAYGEQKIFAGIAIGGALAFLILFEGPISGGSLNPARSIGPAIASGHYEHLWIYLTAPIIGALCAVPIYKIVTAKQITEPMKR
jgi:aquaporin NIP